MTQARVGRALLLAAAILLGVVACTSSRPDGGASTPLAPSSSPGTPTPGPSTTPVATTPVATTPVATTPVATTPVATTPVKTTPVATTPDATVTTSPTGRPSTTTGSPSTTAPGTTGCKASDLTARIIRGAASPGQELAAIQFINAGSVPCTLGGYPRAQLLLHGAPLGKPARPSGGPGRTLRLAPGGIAQSRLDDFTSCNAPLSDHLRVAAPGQTRSFVQPVQLRGCTLRVHPLRHA